MARRFRPAFAALLVSCMLGCGMLGAGTARAQDYPSKPIFFVVGPGPDALARLIGQNLTAAWGQQVLIDIQPTAGGVVAARNVAKAAPDGPPRVLTTGAYTIMQALRPDRWSTCCATSSWWPDRLALPCLAKNALPQIAR